MQKVSSLHFVGIKGVGMTPLAIIAKEAGMTVTGSDIPNTFITEEALKENKIKVFEGFSADHVGAVDAVIVTNAHGGFDNVEATTAKEKQIPVLSQAEAVGEFMKGEILGRSFTGISITGTHGKTTTSSMVATLLKATNQDPSYLIGTSQIPTLGHSGHLGNGTYFVAEADEYMTESTYDRTPKFLWQHPNILVMTNLEYDHPDVYADVQSVQEAFEKFVVQVQPNGLLIICGDDVHLRAVSKKSSAPILTYGYGAGNDYAISSVEVSGDETTFMVHTLQENLGAFRIKVHGEHNVLNATAAIIIGLHIGLPLEQIKNALQSFQGSKRRLEYIGESSQGIVLYDDYAHHPTEIKASLKTLRQLYKKHTIICIFQPHTFSRTQAFFAEFSQAFENADQVILTDIYASLREQQQNSDVSSEQLCEAVKQVGKTCMYLPTGEDVVKYIRSAQFSTPTLLVTMGAGDIYKILSDL